MKKAIFLLLVLVLLCACTSSKQTTIQTRLETYSVEVGTPVLKDPKYYLDLQKYSGEEKGDILKECQMVLETSQDYYEKIGNYQASIQYKDESIDFKIEVVDHKAPQIKGPGQINIKKTKDYDFKSLYEAFDYGEVKEFSIDSSKVNTQKDGQYTLMVNAVDQSGNKNHKTVKVIVGDYKNETEVKLDIPYYHQMDDANAPNGCEATSLYMALNYKKKVPLDLKTFINQLPRSQTPYEGFFGNPFSTATRDDDYYVIFPNALVQYGLQYGLCRDISGSTLDNMKDELRQDHPVIIYGTGGLKKPVMETYYFGEVISNIHIVVLSGFDEEKGIFNVEDPMSRDIKSISFEDFKEIYDSMQYALIVE